MTINQKLESIKKTFQEYNLDLRRINEVIEEIEAYITNYQGINRRLDNTVITLAVLQNENKSLVKTLEKYNKETIELKKENRDLLNTVIEAQEVIKNVLECKKWDVQIVKY